MVALPTRAVSSEVGQAYTCQLRLREADIGVGQAGEEVPVELLLGVRPTFREHGRVVELILPFCSGRVVRNRNWKRRYGYGRPISDSPNSDHSIPVRFQHAVLFPTGMIDCGVWHAFVLLARSPHGHAVFSQVLASEFLELRDMDWGHDRFESAGGVTAACRDFCNHRRHEDRDLGHFLSSRGRRFDGDAFSLMHMRATRVVQPTPEIQVAGHGLVPASHLGISRRWTTPRTPALATVST